MGRFLARLRYVRWVALAAVLIVPALQLGAVRAATPVTITIWSGSWDSPTPPTPIGAGVKAEIARYEQLNPGIKIDWSSYTPAQDPSSYQTLLTAIAGGKAPDISEIDRFLAAEFAAEGAIEPIGPYLSKNAATFALDHALPGAWDELHGFNGQLYGVPVDFDNVGFWALYYNKTLLAQAGITTPPTTWAQLNADAKQATKKIGSRVTTLGYLPYPDTAGELDTLLYGVQGHLISPNGKTAKLNNPTAVAALQQEVAEVDAEGGWNTVSRWIPAPTAPAAQNPFFMGTAAMTDGGDWYLQDIALYAPTMQFGVVPMPNQTGKNYGAWAGGWSWQLVKGTPHAAQAAAFMDYMTSTDAASTFIKAAQAYGAAHHQVVVLPGAFYFAYPDLVKQLNLPALKTKYPEIYNGILSFVNSPKTYAASFARDRNVVPGELWQSEQNAAQAALFHKMSPMAALTQQNAIIQKAINTFGK